MVSCIVIDDDPIIVDVLCEMLKLIKVDILSTGNDGNDAVKLYQKYKPDVVFTDLEMLNYDGIYAIENIKDIDSNAKIVVVTGDLSTSNSALFGSLNIPVINKPFDMYAIKQAMEDVFLTPYDSPTVFEIEYKFKQDYTSYSCIMTYKQYRNFKKLPLIQECEIINNDQKNTELHNNKMQKAIELVAKNDTSYIRKLSEGV